MSNQRLMNETCFAIAKDMLSLVSHLIRENEHREVFRAFYEVTRYRLLCYDAQQERLKRRLYGDGAN
jgi:hypothetical protein